MNFIDTSQPSLGIAMILFIFTLFGTKYYFESQEYENNNKLVYSFFAAIFVAIFSLVTYRQVNIYYSNHNLLTEGFYD